MDVNLDTVALTVSPQEFFPNTLVIYLDEYTGLNTVGEAVGDPGLILTVTFPTIATPLNGNVLLDTLVITAGIVAIQPYQPHDTCELTNALNNLRLDGDAGPVSGDMACELSTLLNNIRTGVAHTPVGDSACSLSKLAELILTEYDAPIVSSIASHYGDAVNLSFADNDGQGNVTVGAGDDRILLIFVAYHRMGLYPMPFINSVTYGGTALTRLTRVDGTVGTGGVGPTVEVFYMLSPPVGTAQAEILLAYNSQWVSAKAVWFSGVKQSNPFASTTYNTLNSVQEISTIIGIGTGQYPLDFVACLDATCTMAPDDATQTVIANGVVGDILRGISHRNGQTGNKIFQWKKTLSVSAFTHVAISLSPSSLSTVPLEVEEPTDDCDLSWAVYDVINAIRGTIH